MRFPKQCKIHKAAGRYAMNGLKLERLRGGKGALLIATDGRMLAVLPVEDADADSPGILPAEVVKEACKGKRSEPANVVSNGSSAGAFEARPIEGEFPRWRQVLPEGEPEHELVFNPGQLATLAEALGTELVRLSVYGQCKPALVRPVGSGAECKEALGVIMPWTIDEDVADVDLGEEDKEGGAA